MTDHFCKLALKFETLCRSLRSLALITLVFHEKFSFRKVNGLPLKNKLKSLHPFRSTLYCPLDDQRPLEKQGFWSKRINNVYIITNHDKVITNCVSFAYYKLRQSVITNYDSFFIINYDKVLTNCDRSNKLRQKYYKLGQNMCRRLRNRKMFSTVGLIMCSQTANNGGSLKQGTLKNLLT